MNKETYMKPISDEMIMAYVDGELNPDQAAAVEQALENDPTLRKKAAIFSETTSMLHGVYDAPLHEKTPEFLFRTLQPAPLANRWRRGVKLFMQAVQLPAMHPVPIFALLAITIISSSLLYTNAFLNSPAKSNYPSLVYDSTFSRGLESTTSGQAFIDQHSSAEIIPILSFQNQQQYYCRQFEIVDRTQGNHFRGSGIACRNNDKQWQTIVYYHADSIPQSQSDNESYELAGASSQLDTLIDEQRQGEILTALQEHELMQQGWKADLEENIQK
jgi:hypothetical protein